MRRDAQKVVYLTFDDGPRAYTKAILDVLKKHQVKATFFVIGNTSPDAIQLYRRIVREEHSLGNHTYSHDYKKVYTSTQSFLKDFYKLENLLWNVVGEKPKILRFPGGTNNTASIRYGGPHLMSHLVYVMKRKRYRICDWNVDSGDAIRGGSSVKSIVRTVLQGCKNKTRAVVLFHDFNENTPTALSQIVRTLLKNGVQFSSLSKQSYNVMFDSMKR